MSYDLMVFAPEAAPRDRGQFVAWYEEQCEWSEDHSYDNPDVSTPALRAWFMEMIQSFPAMNGPFASDELPEDESSLADYSVGRQIIYAGFAWSKAEEAFETTVRLAAKHGLGFFDVSSEKAEAWLPDGKGGLALAHSG